MFTLNKLIWKSIALVFISIIGSNSLKSMHQQNERKPIIQRYLGAFEETYWFKAGNAKIKVSRIKDPNTQNVEYKAVFIAYPLTITEQINEPSEQVQQVDLNDPEARFNSYKQEYEEQQKARR